MSRVADGRLMLLQVSLEEQGKASVDTTSVPEVGIWQERGETDHYGYPTLGSVPKPGWYWSECRGGVDDPRARANGPYPSHQDCMADAMGIG